MSDNTTIVKRLSNQLKKVTDLLQVKVVGLNRVEPKYNSHSPEGRTKGVDSDHIKIFQLAPDKSFAFAFFYASAKPPYVMASMKLGQTLTSAQYSEVTFKEKLNDFVKLLEILKESNNLNPKSAESTFLTNFIKGKEYNPTEAVDETMARIKDRMKAIKKKYVTKIEKKNKLVLDLEKKKTEIQAKVAKAQEKENIEELKKKFHEALSRVDDLKSKLMKDSNVRETEKEVSKINSDLYGYDQEVSKMIKEETSALPKQARDIVQSKAEKLKK